MFFSLVFFHSLCGISGVFFLGFSLVFEVSLRSSMLLGRVFYDVFLWFCSKVFLGP